MAEDLNPLVGVEEVNSSWRRNTIIFQWEQYYKSPPIDTPVLSATNIPSSSHSAPVGNVSSIPPTLGATSDATAASTMAGFSQSMPSMQTNDKIFIQPTLDNKQYVF